MTRREQQIADLLLTHPEGLKSEQIAAALGISKVAASTYCSNMRGAGLLTHDVVWHDEPWHHHRYYVWCLKVLEVAA